MHTSRPAKHNGENFRQYISTVLRLLLLSILFSYLCCAAGRFENSGGRGVLYILKIVDQNKCVWWKVLSVFIGEKCMSGGNFLNSLVAK